MKKPLTEKEETMRKMAVVASTLAFGVEDYEILKLKRGNERICVARMCCYWMMMRDGEMSSIRVGLCFKRDHASALNGCRKINHILELDHKSGFSGQVKKALQYFNAFREKQRENQNKRRIQELENAL